MEAPGTLQRSGDAKLAGVCGGVAERYQVDPLLVRIAAVLLALSAGVGAVLYGAAWLLIPRQGEPPVLFAKIPAAAKLSRRTWILITAGVTVVVMILLGGFSVGLLPALVIGALIYLGRPARHHPTPSQPTPYPAEQTPVYAPLPVAATTPDYAPPTPDYAPSAVNRWGQPLTEEECAAFFAVADPVGLYPEAQPASPPPSVHRSTVITIVAAVAAAVAVLIFGTAATPSYAAPAAALLMVGVGVVLIGRKRRPVGLLVLACLLMASTAGTLSEVPGVDMEGSYVSVPAISFIEPEYAQDVGSFTLDLESAEFDTDTDTSIAVGVGDAVIYLPESGNVIITWEAAAAVFPDGNEKATTEVDETGEFSRITDPAAPTLRIDVFVAAGTLIVESP